jgi:hypothetical protein
MSELAIVTIKGLTATPSSSSSSSSSFALPSGVTYYANVVITNSQSTATPAPFQQEVQIPESDYSNYISYNGVSANFEFFYNGGSVIPAWIESNSSGTLTVWLNLANGIPASNSITVYIGFAPESTNLLSGSGTTGIGEAPQLSQSYAEYDDGASVFNNYWNFAGTTLPSGWSAVGGFTQYSVDNGLTITGADLGSQDAYTGLESNVQLSPPYILEVGADYPTESLSNFLNIIGVGPNDDQQILQAQTDYGVQSYNSGGSTGVIASSGTGVWSLVGTSPNSDYGTLNYGSEASSSSSNPVTFPAYIASPVTAGFTGSLTNNIIEYYIRTRAYPPNGVMPSVTLGSAVT